jgi:hypothetical protein
MAETSGSRAISTRLRRIAELARAMPGAALTTLAHHIDLDLMREAYRLTRKDGAVGVDGQTARDYEADLDANLRSLVERAKSGLYKAPPVRRVYIPKGKGSDLRPLGIPTRYGTNLPSEPDDRAFEDKVLQRAVVMLLEPVYEQDFLGCSYGFRPVRAAPATGGRSRSASCACPGARGRAVRAAHRPRRARS